MASLTLRRGRLDRWTPWLMLLPAALVVAGLVLYPLVYNGYLSLRFVTTINWRAGGQFVGLDNFGILASDPWFWRALGNTALYVVAAVLVELALGFGLALLVHRTRSRLRKALTLCLLLPHMATPVATALIWRMMLNHEYGVVNYLLDQVGLGRVAFTSDGTAAMATVIGIDVWQHTAFCFLVLLAGLMSIPRELFESAAVDGANHRSQFRHIVLPLMWPVILLVVLFRVMGALQAFDHIFVLTRGGPARATELVSIYLYDTLFSLGDFGVGGAVSFVVLAVSVLLSVLLVRVLRRRVSIG